MATNAATRVKNKPKCKYWDKCYRTEPGHKKNYRHPEDDQSDGEENKNKGTTKQLKIDLEGKRVVFCGTLEQLGRRHAEARAKQFGCFVGTDVTKSTDILVVGDDPGAKKEKAEELGIQILTEDEWSNVLLNCTAQQGCKLNRKGSTAKRSDSVESAGKKNVPVPKLRKRKTHDMSSEDVSQVMKAKASTSATKAEDSDTDTEIATHTPAKKTKAADTRDEPMDEDDDSSVVVKIPKLTRSRSKQMEKKPKCKFWNKCYRKNADHLSEFLHPHDQLEGAAAADDKRPQPLHQMDNGDTVDITGGLRGEYTYTIKKVSGHYTCTCISWKTSTKPVHERTCKHLQNWLGDDYEMYRIGKTTGGAGDEAITRSPRHKAIGSLMLAHKWTESVDPKGWWISEKLDGVRAYWDGKSFYSRLGNEFIPPSWFVKDFPNDMTLDGELFGGRGKFQKTVSIVKTPGSGRWSEIQYYIFDAPSIKKPFEGRIADLKYLFGESKLKSAYVIPQIKCKDKEHLDSELRKVEKLGGEGLMIRKPGSKYEHTRSHDLLKIKTFHDAEAVVVGYEQGKGRNASVMGALVCEMECGKRFKVGSGFTDAQRRSPPKKGAIITYRFQEYTNSGSPRFPTFVGVRIDMDGPKDCILPPKGGGD